MVDDDKKVMEEHERDPDDWNDDLNWCPKHRVHFCQRCRFAH